jgi:dCMP deaminase
MAVIKNMSMKTKRKPRAALKEIALQDKTTTFFDVMMERVKRAAETSLHRDIQVGAVIYDPRDMTTVSYGANNLTPGMDETEDRLHCHPLKDLYWSHAERNAIYSAARYGLTTDSMGIAVSWYPCAPCAQAIVNSGIKEMIATEPDWTSAKWGSSWLAAEEILAKAGVAVHFIKQVI